MKKKVMGLSGLIGLVGLSLYAAPSSLELGEKYSNDLQKRFQEHLNRTFGDKKSEVFVNVEIGFSEDTKRAFQQTLRAFLVWQMEQMEKARQKDLEAERRKQLASLEAVGSQKQGPEGEEEGAADADTPGAAAPPYVLPGYVLKRMAALSEFKPSDYNAPSAEGAAPQVGLVAAQKEEAAAALQPVLPFYDTAFLYSISSQIRKVVVKVVLDESLPSDAEVKVQALVASALDFDPARGDQLIISRMPLVPSQPREILAAGAAKLFGDPQFLGPLLQWVLMGSLLFFGLVMGGLILRNLTLSIDLGSLPSWLGGAMSVIHQGGQGKESGAAGAALAAGEGGAGALALPVPVLSGGASRPAESIIHISQDRTQDLYALVGRADPARIALIASRLNPDVSAKFLKHFDQDRLSQILSAMANPQYVDPAVLVRLKDEVEKRLQGLIGGEGEILRVMNQPDQRSRVRMLQALEEKDAKLYRQIRSQVLLMEDLDRMEDHDLSVILQKVGVEDISLLVRDTDTSQEVKDKILRCLARRTAQVVMERSSLGEAPPPEKISQVQGRMLLMAEGMIQQGVVKLNPSGAEAAA